MNPACMSRTKFVGHPTRVVRMNRGSFQFQNTPLELPQRVALRHRIDSE